VLLNYILRNHGVTPYLVDRDAPVEKNFERNEDHRIDHCRTLTAGKLYSPGHYAKAQPWANDAMIQAAERLAQWREDDATP